MIALDALDLVLRPENDRYALVQAGRRDVENAPASGRGRSARLLDQHGHRVGFVEQAQAAGQRACTILSKGGLRSGRTVSEVKERWCAGCGMCVSVCPYGARVMDEKKGVAVVIEALCQGCGACVVTCPSGAAVLRGLSDQQVMAMMDAAL